MSEKQDKISFLITGGTIDGEYHAPLERKITRTKSVIADYIDNVIMPHFPRSYETIIMIDSLEMTDEHREKIVAAIKKTETEKIIITHGTSTMVETAKFIEKKIPDLEKTIVMVGAMIPLEGFYPTDAPFNLGYAVAQVQNRDHGVYMCMNGYCFTPQEAVKNIDIGRFEFKDAS